ncbi:MAG TPA: tetratricopeptide repeat protein [Candidatus Obscuribacterales bacterium]
MQPSFAPLDFLNLLFVPLMVLTAVDMVKNWSSLWDREFTVRDRQRLQKIVLFLLVPLVVLCHELGHVAAIKLFGGDVAEFHYAFMWGYVVPSGTFTTSQLVWSYLAGSLVQVIIGLAALAAALVVASPPVVALLVYLGLWSVAGTVVIYALLSVTGLYGDWIAIYTAPVPNLTVAIAIVHTLLVALVCWCLYGTRPRVWFTAKTQPDWVAEQDSLKSALAAEPSAANWLNLAWSFYRVGLNRQAGDALERARALDADRPAVRMLEGALAYRKGDIATASACFQELTQMEGITDELRARSFVALGGCQMKRQQPENAMTSYGMAIESCPWLADAHFFKAMLLADAGQLDEARAELETSQQLAWVDLTLKEVAAQELAAISAEIDKR